MNGGMYLHNLQNLNQFVAFQIVLRQSAASSVHEVDETVTLRVYNAQRVMHSSGQIGLEVVNKIVE